MAGRPRSVSDDEVFRAVSLVIGDAGPSGLTFAALARASGLSAPALAQRFGSKHGLLVAFAARAPGSVGPTFAAARARARSPLDAVVRSLLAVSRGQRTRTQVAMSSSLRSTARSAGR